MFKTAKQLILVFSAAMIVACSSTPGSESTGEYLDSSALTAKVKASLIDELGTKGFSIQVKTFKDEVQLSGFVDSQRTKLRAGQIADSLNGVRHVRNDIIVK
ncbi:putative periplasmic or secreted lipoprotein [Legionella rubrilucens]|uniref:Putative periplasmic or secreted lipoprotein n=1 Tax=Legionella rubrilucens TaxID=458 RepID=A0A0W0XW64_9GAMM|nr:BON domain-containing protein [Legionella rubrilucens]KTD48719.1 putative periplasmic or secreted lipoprotein [Legionella rubrilucens]